jgi:glycosyltransferase involved in cell wall biosynthesis
VYSGKKVSVLMAVFNTDLSLVQRAIQSVLNQDYQNFELIIIDDGSDNDPQNLLLNYAKMHQDKVSYIRQANSGQSKALNRGVLNSTGDFITILDADDEYKPQHLSSCLLEMEDADLIASTTETVVDKEEDFFVPDKNDHQKLIHVDECILFATLFGKREVFLNLTFDGKYAADAAFYEISALSFKVKKVSLNTYIYYRNMPNSICSVLKRKHQLSNLEAN